jgi:hypothetical protein
LQALHAEVATLKATNADQASTIASLQALLAAHNAEIANSESQTQEMRDAYEALLAARDEVASNLGTAANSMMQEMLAARDAKIATLKAEIASLMATQLVIIAGSESHAREGAQAARSLEVTQKRLEVSKLKSRFKF